MELKIQVASQGFLLCFALMSHVRLTAPQRFPEHLPFRIQYARQAIMAVLLIQKTNRNLPWTSVDMDMDMLKAKKTQHQTISPWWQPPPSPFGRFSQRGLRARSMMMRARAEPRVGGRHRRRTSRLPTSMGGMVRELSSLGFPCSKASQLRSICRPMQPKTGMLLVLPSAQQRH